MGVQVQAIAFCIFSLSIKIVLVQPNETFYVHGKCCHLALGLNMVEPDPQFIILIAYLAVESLSLEEDF